MSRRTFLAAASLGPALIAAGRPPARRKPGLGICDWSSGKSGPEAMDVARDLGLEGVQISPASAADRLSYAEKSVQEAYRKKSQETGVAVSSLALTLSNEFPIATDPRAPAWLEQTIDATADLGCRAILLAFFGNGDLTQGKELKRKEIDAVVERLRDAAPRAAKRKVVLGIESYLPADELLRILERVGSDSVGVYYDIANTTSRSYDVPAEIRRLKGRICEVHLKDYKGALGSGVALPAIAKAFRDTGYRGWYVLENSVGRDRQAYVRDNVRPAREALSIPAYQKPRDR